MTEQEWLASDGPGAMLQLIEQTADEGSVIAVPGRPSFRVSDRKLRLFACACARVFYPELRSDPNEVDFLPSVERAELAADLGQPPPASGEWIHSERYARRAAGLMVEDLRRRRLSGLRHVAALLRDVVGNPFRPWIREDAFAAGKPIPGPKLNIVWSAWLTPTVLSLATAAYDERNPATGHLDPTRLAVLSDALVDEGCDPYGPLVWHLRGRDDLGWYESKCPHVRGCFALDLILGKE